MARAPRDGPFPSHVSHASSKTVPLEGVKDR
jgi:hypothetical protein